MKEVDEKLFIIDINRTECLKKNNYSNKYLIFESSLTRLNKLLCNDDSINKKIVINEIEKQLIKKRTFYTNKIEVKAKDNKCQFYDFILTDLTISYIWFYDKNLYYRAYAIDKCNVKYKDFTNRNIRWCQIYGNKIIDYDVETDVFSSVVYFKDKKFLNKNQWEDNIKTNFNNRQIKLESFLADLAEISFISTNESK